MCGYIIAFSFKSINAIYFAPNLSENGSASLCLQSLQHFSLVLNGGRSSFRLSSLDCFPSSTLQLWLWWWILTSLFIWSHSASNMLFQVSLAKHSVKITRRKRSSLRFRAFGWEAVCCCSLLRLWMFGHNRSHRSTLRISKLSPLSLLLCLISH